MELSPSKWALQCMFCQLIPFLNSTGFVLLESLSLKTATDNVLLQDFTTTFYFRHFWKDPRLTFNRKFGQVVVTGDEAKKFWLPDTHFLGEKNAFIHSVMNENSFLKIHNSGSMTRSIRMTLKSSCSMSFKLFPKDSFECFLQFQSRE